tara:strand:- start:1001 stop:1717 length:717 start_codon:yes stop_codon:yes gene_type:complete
LYADHEAVKAYIHKPSMRATNRVNRAAIRAGVEPRPATTETPGPVTDSFGFVTGADSEESVSSNGVRPEAPGVVLQGAAGGSPIRHPGPSLTAHVRQYLYDVQTQIAGAFPDHVDNLGSMTLREIVERFGSLPNLKDAVKAMANFADMRNKEGLAAKRRGELVSRDVLTGTLLPLVELAFRRLVSEAPVALTDQIVARVLAGGDDLRSDVEALIRLENSGILTDCKEKLVLEFERVGD